ncbi:SprT-like domain-containing protein [Salinicoccus sp. Marseille-QA3877]
MNTRQLEIYADEFLRKNFDLSLDVPLRISKRMKSKLGVFSIKYNDHKVLSSEIVISYNFIINNDKEAVLDVLYHECVHYALYKKRLPFRDSDPEFINTLEHLGISKTRRYKYRGQSFLYECRKCKYQFSKNMKGYEKRYICGKCHGKFTYIGTVQK